VIFRVDRVGRRATVTTDKESVLREGWRKGQVTQTGRLIGIKKFEGKRQREFYIQYVH